MILPDVSALTDLEIENMREGATIWKKIRNELESMIQIGTTGEFLNSKAKELFEKFKVEPAFFNYNNFPGHICVSVNDCIIHGVGNSTPFRAEDKVTLDIGFKYKNLYIDSAFTTIVDPSSNKEYVSFVEKCRKALWAGIKAADKELKDGKPLFNGDIAFSIESLIKSFNDKQISLIDGFVGHTIGKSIHLKPHIFNKGLSRKQGDRIIEGSVICIEPMLLGQSTGEYRIGRNGFDIFSKNEGSFTCHWEHMVLIKKGGIEVLTASEEEIREYLGQAK